MKKALVLAARAQGMTSPNPLVGAVLVRKGRIISEGYHKKAGAPHAEVIAINNARRTVKGATLYVTLEPCCHRDKRTPPCTEKIISSGIKKVVISMKDPNPRVSGKGLKELRKAGIEIVSGVLETRARKLNEPYIRHITTGMPFVTMKVAMTLDGKIATPEGESKWITGEKARRLVHKMRGRVDGILTAIGTVKADNPLLTCRAGKRKNPVRIILDPALDIPMKSRILSIPPHTVVVCRKPDEQKKSAVSKDKRQKLTEMGIQIMEYDDQTIDLVWLMKELGNINMNSILIEGGASLNSYCLEAGIVDKVMFFIAPKIIGGKESVPVVGGKSFRRLADAYRITQTKIRQIGDDFLIEGYVARQPA